MTATRHLSTVHALVPPRLWHVPLNEQAAGTRYGPGLVVGIHQFRYGLRGVRGGHDAPVALLVARAVWRTAHHVASPASGCYGRLRLTLHLPQYGLVDHGPEVEEVDSGIVVRREPAFVSDDSHASPTACVEESRGPFHRARQTVGAVGEDGGYLAPFDGLQHLQEGEASCRLVGRGGSAPVACKDHQPRSAVCELAHGVDLEVPGQVAGIGPRRDTAPNVGDGMTFEHD